MFEFQLFMICLMVKHLCKVGANLFYSSSLPSPTLCGVRYLFLIAELTGGSLLHYMNIKPVHLSVQMPVL